MSERTCRNVFSIHTMQRSKARARKRRRPQAGLQLEQLEARCLLNGNGFRPITEIGNNLAVLVHGLKSEFSSVERWHYLDDVE
jgi:hypothetical protein